MRRNGILIMALAAMVAAVLTLGAGVAAAGLPGGGGGDVLQGAYGCPPVDTGGFVLDPAGSDTSTDPILCDYPDTDGVLGVFFCTYSATTGVLVEDHNVGFCPANAVRIDAVPGQLDALLAAVTGVGPGKSLANKVKEIQANVAANQTANACTGLNDFISLVKAQKGKKLTVAQADSFIAQANTIKTGLGC
jgi:hypothetical protein